MYESLLRDEPHVPAVQQRLRDFHGFLDAVRGMLMTGRGLRGNAARRTQAAIGHALAFPTWHSLTQGQTLTDADAAALMSGLCRVALLARGRRSAAAAKSAAAVGASCGTPAAA